MNTALMLSAQKLKKGVSLLYWLGGSIIIVLAALSFFTQRSISEILIIINQNFGLSFSILFVALVAFAGTAIYQLNKARRTQQAYWYECGIQAANGISSLALTFTLFGIAMGIKAMSEHPLTPETVQGLIADLTSQFSLAFMTTVVGLPTATLLRAIISIQVAKLNNLK